MTSMLSIWPAAEEVEYATPLAGKYNIVCLSELPLLPLHTYLTFWISLSSRTLSRFASRPDTTLVPPKGQLAPGGSVVKLSNELRPVVPCFVQLQKNIQARQAYLKRLFIFI